MDAPFVSGMTHVPIPSSVAGTLDRLQSLARARDQTKPSGSGQVVFPRVSALGPPARCVRLPATWVIPNERCLARTRRAPLAER
jgi:hypothetical protein